MPEPDPDYSFAAGLYWLAFVVTENQELSVELAINAIDAEDWPESEPSPEVRARLRKKVVANALAARGRDLASSAAKQPELQFDRRITPNPGWTLDSNTNLCRVQRALLAIDLFSRCALLLTVFESFTLKAATALLGSDERSVSEGRLSGLRQLTQNLIGLQG